MGFSGWGQWARAAGKGRGGQSRCPAVREPVSWTARAWVGARRTRRPGAPTCHTLDGLPSPRP